MKIPYTERKNYWPIRKRDKGNYKGQEDTNSRVYKHKRLKAYETYADGYCPMPSIRGRRARDTRYKDKRKGKL